MTATPTRCVNEIIVLPTLHVNTPHAHSDITLLGTSDTVNVANLLYSSYHDDLGFSFVFQTLISRQRWLPRVCIASTQLATSYGVVTGFQMDNLTGVPAVALWFLPSRPFPPPWYHNLLPSLRLLPMMFAFPTLIRANRLHEFYLSLMPRDRRFIYLAGLAVRNDCRNQQLGRRLINWGLNLASADGCAVFLHCWPALVSYYERLGFSSFAEGELRGIESTCHGLLWEP